MLKSFFFNERFCLPGTARKSVVRRLGQHGALLVFVEASCSSLAPQSHTGTPNKLGAFVLIYFTIDFYTVVIETNKITLIVMIWNKW